MYVYVDAYVYAYIDVHAYAYNNVHTHMRTNVSCLLSDASIHVRISIPLFMCTCVHEKHVR